MYGMLAMATVTSIYYHQIPTGSNRNKWFNIKMAENGVMIEIGDTYNKIGLTTVEGEVMWTNMMVDKMGYYLPYSIPLTPPGDYYVNPHNRPK